MSSHTQNCFRGQVPLETTLNGYLNLPHSVVQEAGGTQKKKGETERDREAVRYSREVVVVVDEVCF